jgi:hypothetical protein
MATMHLDDSCLSAKERSLRKKNILRRWRTRWELFQIKWRGVREVAKDEAGKGPDS